MKKNLLRLIIAATSMFIIFGHMETTRVSANVPITNRELFAEYAREMPVTEAGAYEAYYGPAWLDGSYNTADGNWTDNVYVRTPSPFDVKPGVLSIVIADFENDGQDEMFIVSNEGDYFAGAEPEAKITGSMYEVKDGAVIQTRSCEIGAFPYPKPEAGYTAMFVNQQDNGSLEIIFVDNSLGDWMCVDVKSIKYAESDGGLNVYAPENDLEKFEKWNLNYSIRLMNEINDNLRMKPFVLTINDFSDTAELLKTEWRAGLVYSHDDVISVSEVFGQTKTELGRYHASRMLADVKLETFYSEEFSMAATPDAYLKAAEDVYNTWEAELNRLYEILETKLPAEEFTKLKEAQRKWVTEKENEAAGMAADDGSSDWYFKTTQMYRYLIMFTVERTLELAHLYLTDDNPGKMYTYVNPENTTLISSTEINELLSSDSAAVVKKYNITDADNTGNVSEMNIWTLIPAFRCENPAIEITFMEGTRADTLDTVLSQNEKPYEVLPLLGTTITLSGGRPFRAGEDMRLFREKFGEGDYSVYWNLRGDSLTYHLDYHIDGLDLHFSSYEEDFSGYTVTFSK